MLILEENNLYINKGISSVELLELILFLLFFTYSNTIYTTIFMIGI